jgi:hypothetical protein
MGKSTHFYGQSVLGKLISLVDDTTISRNSRKYKADRYTKRFTTKDHLISMLFCVFAKCSSLREMSGAMIGLSGKTKHFKLDNLPYRSTLADANKRRDPMVFAGIYNDLLLKYGHLISDSRIRQVVKKQIEIFDSTSISLFKDILKCVGRLPENGKRKGGIEMHTIINADETVPKMVWFTSAAKHDHILLEKLKMDKGTIYVFDKGYNDYKAFKRFCDHETGFVTRIKDNAVYGVEQRQLIEQHIHSGVVEDQLITLDVKETDKVSSLRLRKITFHDRVLKRKFEFLTNLFEMRPDLVAAIYKLRWQIELLFKQLKQNFPLKYFLGDNENAVKIQIYCTLIVNLLLTVVRKQLKKNWAFSNLVSFCRIHLFNYIHLMKFLENPEKDWMKKEKPPNQHDLFSQGLLF